MLIPVVPRIWIAIEGETLRIIEVGTMEVYLQTERHPEKKFIEIAKVEGDIGALVDLAIKSYIEKAIKETEKDIADKYKEMIEFCKDRLKELENTEQGVANE